MELIDNKSDKVRGFNILENAFHQAPGLSWMLRESKGERSTRQILKVMLEDALAKKGAFISSDKNGIVLYYQTNNKNFTFKSLAIKAFAFLFVLGIKKGIKAIKYQKLIASTRPAEIGWVGALVATDQSVVGSAAAYEIKNEMFRIADESNQPIYLETTVPRVSILYKTSGYELYNQITHPYADLTVWFFRRNPKSK